MPYDPSNPQGHVQSGPGGAPIATGDVGAVGGGYSQHGSNNPYGYDPAYSNPNTYYGTVIGDNVTNPGGARQDTWGSGTVKGGGLAGGQQVLQPGGWDIPDIPNNLFTMGDSFDDPNAANIYKVINSGINQRGNAQSPLAALTALGANAQVAPGMMTQGAQLSPQMMVNSAQLNTAGDQQYQAAQNAQINALAQQAAGVGPSVAEVQAQQQAQQAMAAQMAALGSQRGASSAALGQRQAAMQGAAGLQAAAQTGALGRAQEALSAQQQLSQALSGARGQTQTTAQQQAALQQQALLANQGAFNQAATQQAQFNQAAGLGNQQIAAQLAGQNAQLAQQGVLQQGSMNQQTNLANLQAQQTQEQLNNQMFTQGLASYMQQNQTDISNAQAFENLLANEQLQKYGIDKNVAINTMNNMVGVAGAGMSGLGAAAGLLAMSDRSAKKDINSANEKLRGFLESLARKVA